MELSDLSKHKSSDKNRKSAQKNPKTKTKQEESLTTIHFPDADIQNG